MVHVAFKGYVWIKFPSHPNAYSFKWAKLGRPSHTEAEPFGWSLASYHLAFPNATTLLLEEEEEAAAARKQTLARAMVARIWLASFLCRKKPSPRVLTAGCCSLLGYFTPPPSPRVLTADPCSPLGYLTPRPSPRLLTADCSPPPWLLDATISGGWRKDQAEIAVDEVLALCWGTTFQ